MPSEAQVTCLECGATMLATTAARTGGLCMACKQGIRKNIEASKIHCQQQRQPDPFRDHWRALIQRVYSAPDGFYLLSHHEQTYYLGCVLEGEVYNGGIGQFFDNSSGDFYRETLDALVELGAMRCHAILLAARQALFPQADPRRDQAERKAVMPEYPDAPGAPRPAWDLELDRLDDEFYTDPDKLGERLRRYAIDHELVKV
jgi:hypothetical protein